MKSEDIQRLVKIVEESDIAELEVRAWGRRVRITKYASMATANNHPPALQQYYVPGTPPMPAGSPQTAPAAEAPSAPAAEAESAKGEQIRSPMVGTFYRSPAPDAEPYVKVGDTVKEGQVLCIIEAMKLMNEVEAEFPCRILEILVENAQPVEYNQPLFRVERL